MYADDSDAEALERGRSLGERARPEGNPGVVLQPVLEAGSRRRPARDPGTESESDSDNRGRQEASHPGSVRCHVRIGVQGLYELRT